MASVVPNFFGRIRSVVKSKSRENGNEDISCQLNKVDNFLVKMQKILLWDDPFLSGCCIISVNIVFWFIIYLDLNFYGILFTALLIVSLEQLWSDQISPIFYKKDFDSQSENSSETSSQRLFSVSEVSDCLKVGKAMIRDTYVKAKLLRQTQPGTFCIITCCCFLLLNGVGRSLSGTTSLYAVLMLTMTVPGVVVHLLPSCVISSLSNFYSSSRKEDTEYDDGVEPYLPETNEEALELLHMAGDLALPAKDDDEDSNDLLLERISARSNDTSDSLCSKSSFYPELPVMPSPENSTDFLEMDFAPEENSEANDINFRSQHFDGDSSSEEEFVKGLDLTEKQKKTKKEETEGRATTKVSMLNPEKLISLGANLLTAAAAAQQSQCARSERESSSDTDSFEMISEEDM